MKKHDFLYFPNHHNIPAAAIEKQFTRSQRKTKTIKEQTKLKSNSL